MSLKFKPEHFSDAVGIDQNEDEFVSQSKIAQRIFDEWLSKQPLIFGWMDAQNRPALEFGTTYKNTTHQVQRGSER